MEALLSHLSVSRGTFACLKSPLGLLTLRCDERGALVEVSLEDTRARARALGFEESDLAVRAAREQLEDYFEGGRTAFELPLAPCGTTFQRRVWRALLEIPFGRTASYAEIAQSIGIPRAFRAVGLANGRNPIALVIPCHRVISSDGSIGGYAGGLDRKRWLLAWERRNASSRDEAPRSGRSPLSA